ELGVPVFAHALARAPLDKLGIELDGTLEDGQRIVLGGDPPFPLCVLHTPGHTPGHLAFFDETHGSLIAGDLAAGVGTIVIDPPEGDMDAYLRSLERALELGPHTVFPAHGPPLVPAVGKLHELREHRLRREQKVLDAWRNGKKTPGAMVAEVYDDAPKEVHPIAERQIAAHLARLEKLGRLD
ncbi:MAG: MBL fold metallo-hydrolase, partial [Thermoanaerobaculia bacterium]|nr:MBL fold metallo-hydrolase [Thermoanaerobaculia bacterium]